jgi:hypothetical protein
MPTAERLKCLDELSRAIAEPTRPAEADSWVVSQTTSPIDYSPIVSASAASQGASSAMQLAIYCRSGRTELKVTAPELSRKADEYALTYSINGNRPIQVAAVQPASGAGAAFSGDVVRLLGSLPDQGELAIQLSSRSGKTLAGSFSLGGLKTVRDKIAAGCKWPRAIASPN